MSNAPNDNRIDSSCITTDFGAERNVCRSKLWPVGVARRSRAKETRQHVRHRR
jgi:hypothetical protein